MTKLKIVAAGFLNFLWNDVVTHFPVRLVRLAFLRLLNKRVSSKAVILMHARILNFWQLEIGPRSVLNQYTVLDCRRFKVIIDHDVDIGPYTKIWTLGHDPDSPEHSVAGADVHFHHHVWIASGVTILPGVEIGEGAVVAAGSVVTKNIPGKQVWGGSPAQYIRERKNDLMYQLRFNPYFE